MACLELLIRNAGWLGKWPVDLIIARNSGNRIPMTECDKHILR